MNSDKILISNYFAEYEKAAKSLLDKGSKIKLAKVDATVEKELGEEHKVQGFPTLKFFKNGTPKEYSGPREAEVQKYVKKATFPP
jgi:protein disulfide-isomerase A1